MTNTEKEKLIQSDISSIENRVRHAFNQGYDLGYKDGLQKSETVTEFADHCRECGAKYGKLLKKESSGDLINREETLTAFADYVGSGMSMDDYDALWNIVVKMPSVKQEPKIGHWISIVVNRQHKLKCDKCDYSEPEYATHIRNYCPNCGTKMVEQESEEI